MAAACHPAKAVAPLTSTEEIRSLAPAVAAEKLPVEVRGVVSFAYPGTHRGNIIIEQQGTGIFVNVMMNTVWKNGIVPGQQPNLEIGRTKLLIRGHTNPGQYAPVIVAEEMEIIGTETLPPPRPFVLSEVMTGTMDCQRLEIRGVVQGASMTEIHDPMLVLELAVPTGRLIVECLPPGHWTREKLLGARVRIEAVGMTYFNIRGEMLGVHFLIGQPDQIVVEKPAPMDPFSVPQVPLAALQPFSPTGPNLERVQIEGQVTLSRPGEFLYLEAKGRAVRISTRDTKRYAPGDWIVASGFIELHQSFAELREAVVRRTSSGTLDEPPLLSHRGLISASERRWGSPAPVDYNGRLIRLEGSLTKVEKTNVNGRRLLLTTEGGSLAVMLEAASRAASLDDLLPGSKVQVTGVCEMQFPSTQMLTDFPNPSGVTLLMRSAADLRVLESASWWTIRRQWILVGSISGLLALALVWNLMLRRLVKKRGLQLAAETRARDRVEIEYDATLRERTRLAADLHDTLEQALTGLAFQLDTSKVLSIKAPDTSARHLELGRQLLTRSREDLRRSIWNLRARELEDNNFADALRSAALQAAEGRPMEITVEENGEAQPLPEFIAGNLLLLAQEAMTNAIKHGHPETIAVRVDYEDGWITLSVRDDGAGFDPKRAPGLHEGHFGLQGMRERANRLDGTVQVQSRPKKGASITVKVPLPVDPARNTAAAV